MDGWMDGRTDGWTGGQMYGQMDETASRWIDPSILFDVSEITTLYIILRFMVLHDTKSTDISIDLAVMTLTLVKLFLSSHRAPRRLSMTPT